MSGLGKNYMKNPSFIYKGDSKFIFTSYDFILLIYFRANIIATYTHYTQSLRLYITFEIKKNYK